MRKITRISLALGASAALLSVSAIPASAADEVGPVPPAVLASDEAIATIVVEGGYIEISDVEDVAAEQQLKPGEEATIDIPSFTVTDTRAGTSGWNVDVALSAFTSKDAAADDALIPVEKATYLTADPVPTGTVAVAPVGGVFAKAGVVTAVAATNVRGNNTVTWSSSLTIPVPSDALAGTYTATLTHSAL